MISSPAYTRTLLLLITVVGSYGHGTFRSYNNEERQKVEQAGFPNLNEVESADFHWSGDVGNDRESTNSKHVTRYVPTWESLDSRPLPKWFDQSKIGIFIHWGVFSVPGIADAYFWKNWMDGTNETRSYMQRNYKPSMTYQELAPEFTAEFYDPVEWAKLFKKSGAKYVVLTSKHLEGYTLWPSRYSAGWNAKDVGPNRDLVGDLAHAIRNTTDLHFGLYHCLLEFQHPLYQQDQRNNYTTDEFARFKATPALYELVNNYEPEIVWSDCEWEASDSYWKAKEFLTWLYNDSPVKDTVVTNDRWGHGTQCHHGGYLTCGDKYNPGVLQPHKWENCFTMDKHSWGYRRNAKAEEYITPQELLTTVVETVACGGNVLVNVGPTKEGTIAPIMQERLHQMGEWLDINGEAIYETVPYLHQNDTLTPSVWYTMNPDGTKVFAMITKWPGESITLGSFREDKKLRVQMLGADGVLNWTMTSKGIQVDIPRPDKIRSKWVWTLVFSMCDEDCT